MKMRKELWLLVLTLALLAGFLAPPVSAAGPRLVVRVNEPFEIDGQVYEAGKVSLREVREYSPVATLNEIRVNGRSLGVVLARDMGTVSKATQNEMIFERSERGHLVLAAVAIEGESVRRLYRLGEGENSGTWQDMSPARPALLASAK